AARSSTGRRSRRNECSPVRSRRLQRNRFARDKSMSSLRAGLIGLLAAASTVSAQTPNRPAAADGAIAPPLSPRNANYSIEARLDPPTRTVSATERITWRNITEKPATELQFHLYWNAWRNNESTWLRESALVGRPYADRGADDRGSVDIGSIALENADRQAGADLKPSMRFIAPDDGNPEDRTVMAVSLPQPVAPGTSITVRVSWTAHVPRTFSRTGAIGNFFFIAQWFPKLGVLEDQGWNCHQFHFSTEFFSDYGSYDVELTVPGGWTVGATGVQRERRDNSNRTTTHRYYQDDVHDFAWTTSPDYIERTARFEHARLPPVEMRLLLQPEHAGQADRHFDATRAALQSYGEWYGAYPYGHITIIDPAYGSDT